MRSDRTARSGTKCRSGFIFRLANPASLPSDEAGIYQPTWSNVGGKLKMFKGPYFQLDECWGSGQSIMITANQPFGEWNRVFPDPAMTLAAVDRLVHHSTIFEMNVESYRRRSAMEAKRQRGRPASFAIIKANSQFVAERQSETDDPLASDNQHDTFIPAAT